MAGGVERGQIRRPGSREVAGIVVPEPLHGGPGEEIAGGVLRVRWPDARSVRHRVEQHLVVRQRPTAVARLRIVSWRWP